MSKTKPLTVGELREIITGLPNDIPVRAHCRHPQSFDDGAITTAHWYNQDTYRDSPLPKNEAKELLLFDTVEEDYYTRD